MDITKLIEQINRITNTNQICVMGAVMIDLVMQTPKLPNSGDDIKISQQGQHLGGCAFNIALMLKRLGLNSYNVLPIGNGPWANEIKKTLTRYNISSNLYNPNADNGWCMALVEPSGERTFLTIEGVENQWNTELLNQVKIEPQALIYLAGYQLASATGDKIINWLESLSTPFRLFLDLGPRICDLSPINFARLLALKPILSLNRLEAEYLGLKYVPTNLRQNVESFAKSWFKEHDCPIIIRLDCDGAYSYNDEGGSWAEIFPTKVVDTIGAGDHHAGGVLAALSANWPLSEALILGNAVASYIVAQQGADRSPTKSQLIKHIYP